MATVIDRGDGLIILELNAVERETFAGLPPNELESYMTLWLRERTTQVFQQQFAKLSPQDQGEVLTKLRDAGK